MPKFFWTFLVIVLFCAVGFSQDLTFSDDAKSKYNDILESGSIAFVHLSDGFINLIRICTCRNSTYQSTHVPYDPDNPQNTGCSSPGTRVIFERTCIDGEGARSPKQGSFPIRLEGANSAACPVIAEVHFDIASERGVSSMVAEKRLVVVCPDDYDWDGIACYPRAVSGSFWFWFMVTAFILLGIWACYYAFSFARRKQQQQCHDNERHASRTHKKSKGAIHHEL